MHPDGREYFAVGNRCAFHLDSIEDMSRDAIRRHLRKKGFKVTTVDVVKLARSLVGRAGWKRAARSWDAPACFDCSSFTKWLYAQKGIWLPRRGQQQFEYCTGVWVCGYDLNDARPGDLLFVSSPFRNGVRTPGHRGLHVCLVTERKTAICATNSELGTGIVEISIQKLLRTREFEEVRSPVLRDYYDDDPVTLITPKEREIETSDDVQWMLP